ncbi:MAG: hydroxymyristoyl-ACP dehydratase [Prevotellaceae bacterium]|jgi:predicted hotdog family 3-hydroxylacyl-ACP dehydratase|nr:hydroxymyristoyl-ACP dehydratase [Prevotellaceae bacterium]
MENDIKKYIRQREPIIMVDAVIENDGKVETGLYIDKNNMFLKDGLFRESGIVEHIAQSVATIMGLECEEANKPVPLGFIVSVRDLEIFDLPAAGSTLTTEITIVNKVLNVVIVKGYTRIRQTPVARCEMRIFIEETN